MPTYNVVVHRTEIWSTSIEVEADSAEQAKETIQEALNDEGWDAVSADEGDYDECYSTVHDVKLKQPGDNE